MQLDTFKAMLVHSFYLVRRILSPRIDDSERDYSTVVLGLFGKPLDGIETLIPAVVSKRNRSVNANLVHEPHEIVDSAQYGLPFRRQMIGIYMSMIGEYLHSNLPPQVSIVEGKLG
jgi:hypothetical protein